MCHVFLLLMTPLTCCCTLTALLAAFLAAFLLASDAPPYSLPLLLESLCESSYHPQLSPNVDEDIGFILHAHESTLRVAHLEAQNTGNARLVALVEQRMARLDARLAIFNNQEIQGEREEEIGAGTAVGAGAGASAGAVFRPEAPPLPPQLQEAAAAAAAATTANAAANAATARANSRPSSSPFAPGPNSQFARTPRDLPWVSLTAFEQRAASDLGFNAATWGAMQNLREEGKRAWAAVEAVKTQRTPNADALVAGAAGTTGAAGAAGAVGAVGATGAAGAAGAVGELDLTSYGTYSKSRHLMGLGQGTVPLVDCLAASKFALTEEEIESGTGAGAGMRGSTPGEVGEVGGVGGAEGAGAGASPGGAGGAGGGRYMTVARTDAVKAALIQCGVVAIDHVLDHSLVDKLLDVVQTRTKICRGPNRLRDCPDSNLNRYVVTYFSLHSVYIQSIFSLYSV